MLCFEHLIFLHLVTGYSIHITGASRYNIFFIGDLHSLLSRSDAGGYTENIVGDAENPWYFSWGISQRCW